MALSPLTMACQSHHSRRRGESSAVSLDTCACMRLCLLLSQHHTPHLCSWQHRTCVTGLQYAICPVVASMPILTLCTPSSMQSAVRSICQACQHSLWDRRVIERGCNGSKAHNASASRLVVRKVGSADVSLLFCACSNTPTIWCLDWQICLRHCHSGSLLTTLRSMISCS